MPPIPRLIAVLLLAGPAAAQQNMAPEDFEALSEGRTLHFSLFGEFFGAEQFFANRRSLWMSGDGQCEEGVWHAEGEAICFSYPSQPEPFCWHFRKEGGRYAAHRLEQGIETGFAIELDRIDDQPLPCPGPDVGM
jgi:hypothetical protein